MLEEKLRKLDLSDKEVDVYMAVIKYGKMSPASINKITGIKRPTVYAVGKDLIKMGLIDADTSGTTTYYMAVSPESLSSIIDKDKRAIEDKEKIIAEIAEELKNIPQSKKRFVPKIKFVEYKENIEEFLYRQLPIWTKSITKGELLWLGFQDHSFLEYEPYRKWVDFQWKNNREGIEVKLLTNDSKVEKEMKKVKLPLRHVKFWKGSLNFTASQWIAGDYSIILMTREKPHYLVQTHDPVYAQNMRELFKNLWTEIG